MNAAVLLCKGRGKDFGVESFRPFVVAMSHAGYCELLVLEGWRFWEAGCEAEVKLSRDDAAGSLRSRREDKPRRPDYKFHKKVPRAKVHNRSNGLDDFAVDGTALPVGRKGGIMRVSA